MSKKLKLQTTKNFASVQCVCFELLSPEAREVFVAGSFNDWDPSATPMSEAGNGRWAKELVLSPGRYEYRFVVDGQWIDDPRANEFIANPHGGRNAVLIVNAI